MSDSFNFNNIRIVLVNTSHPGNIGAAARAMKNMGLQHLVLVRPDQFPSGVAVGRAVSALDILDNAIVVDSLAEAISDCGLVIGTSARQRSIPLKMLWPDECADEIVKATRDNQVALVFGREDSGLTNQEIQMCHWHVQIPANDDYSSLNLAAAVLLVCYEIRRGFMRSASQEAPQEQDYWDIARATGEQLVHFYEHLEKVLVRIEFHDPENPRQLLQRLRRMFGRISIDTMEMNILRG
ncbi:MAG: RNA methyltransferase, partial [Pseudohongiellaceae bacterium]